MKKQIPLLFTMIVMLPTFAGEISNSEVIQASCTNKFINNLNEITFTNKQVIRKESLGTKNFMHKYDILSSHVNKNTYSFFFNKSGSTDKTILKGLVELDINTGSLHIKTTELTRDMIEDLVVLDVFESSFLCTIHVHNQ